MKKILTILFLIISSIYAFGSENITFSQHSTSSFNEIDISLSFEDLFITETTTDEFSIEISCNNKHIQPVVKLTDEKIHVHTIKRITHFGDNCTITLSIPQNYKFENINISSSSGNLNIGNLNSSNLHLKTTSGEIEAENIYADDESKISTTSGKINIKKLFAEDFEICSTSGDIKIDSVSASESEFDATSGNIIVNNFDGEILDTETTSGKIIFKNTLCDYFNFESTSGSISIEFSTSPLATSKIHSTSGSINLYVPEECGFDVIFSTNSGFLEDRISDNKFSPRGEYRNSIYGGGPEIIVKTTSGNFCLDN